MKIPNRVEDITGKIYGKLIVIKPVEFTTKISKKIELRWLCRCSCENKTEIITSALRLRSGETKSCGCYRAERMASVALVAQIANTKYHPSETSARAIFRSRYSEDDLTFEEFYSLSQQNCFYCNSAPNNKYKTVNLTSSDYVKENCLFIYNGLDRIDSLKLHSKNNVVSCCFQCNAAKSNMTLDQFITWITILCDNN